MRTAGFNRTILASLFVCLALVPPVPAAAPARVSDLMGEWAWTCCENTYYGRFQITSTRQDGSFIGRFMMTNASDVGTIEGWLKGDRVSFTRRVTHEGTSYEQKFYARLVFAGGSWRMTEGYWNGYGETAVASRAFSAEKVS